jgi:hypothetical protein
MKEEDRAKLQNERADKELATEDALRLAVQAAYLEVGKGVLDRAVKRAEFVTTAAGAIGTSYAGLLALVYSVSNNKAAARLPIWGIAPGVFLGFAIMLSVFYVAFVRGGTTTGNYLPRATNADGQEERLLFFLGWVTKSVLERVWALRTAVVSLGVGVALTPLPFLTITDGYALGAIIIGAIIVVLTGIVSLFQSEA